eukprot:51946-Pelagomonas_calceolata.AAC.2
MGCTLLPVTQPLVAQAPGPLAAALHFSRWDLGRSHRPPAGRARCCGPHPCLDRRRTASGTPPGDVHRKLRKDKSM